MTKKHWLALALFLGTVCALGQFYSRWWFNGADDFHTLYLAYKAKNIGGALNFFYDGHSNQDAGPSNCIRNPERSSFMTTYYRPVHLIFSTILYWTFDTNAAGFFLFNVLLHALNTVLIFFLLSGLATTISACIASLFFAFHPQIAYRFGAFANIQYYFGTLLILLILLLFKRYLDTQKIWLTIPICLLFFLALITREVYIVLPAILLLMSPCFGAQMVRDTRAKLSLLTMSAFFTALIYLSIRLYLYPFNSSGATISLPPVLILFKNKIPQILVCMYDTLWLSWLPWGHTSFRLCITLPILCILLTLFIFNQKKTWILLSLACAGLMLWPGIIGHYSPRYFYEMAPFILCAYIFLFTYYNGPLKQYHQWAKAFILLPCALLIHFSTDSFDRRATKLHTASKAINKLLNDPLVHNKPLCFLSYPSDGLGDQPAEICWVIRKNDTIPVYCDSAGNMIQANAHIVTPTRWSNNVSSYYTKNYISVTPVHNGFRYIALNPNKMHFFINSNNCSIGKKIIHKTEVISGVEIVTDFTLIIDEQYRNKFPAYITWDYKKQEFIL